MRKQTITLTASIFATAVTLLALFGVTSPTQAQMGAGDGSGRKASNSFTPMRFQLDNCLVIGSLGGYGRNALYVDALVAGMIDGTLQQPKGGGMIARHDDEMRTWQERIAEKGQVQDALLRGGYLYWKLDVPMQHAGIYLMNARGSVASYVNGTVRAGDGYFKGRALHAIQLVPGENEFYFHVGRGRLKVELEQVDPNQPASFSKKDPTLASVLAGHDEYQYGALPIINQTEAKLEGLELRLFTHAYFADGTVLRDQTRQRVPPLHPLGSRKQPFTYHVPQGYDQSELIEAELRAELWHSAGDEAAERKLDEQSMGLHVAGEGDRYDVTFISEIDRSVQYYSVKPAIPLEQDAARDQRMGLVLSLHGASVEARGQANSYANKRWCHIVAATNRRPFGFDWEDWGRLDALEVLAHATQRLNPDPSRIYLTGHSMGGHGTHQLGVTYPDRFAAIAPSAGWLDFWGYGGGPGYKSGSIAQDILDRAANPSRTLQLISNHAHNGIYLLHGDADDNVPISEAQRMVEALEPFHKDFDYHWQPGAGHWWNGTPGAGVGCVDWPPMFDFFSRRRVPDEREVREIDFSTMNPGISASCYWARIEQQQLPLARSQVTLRMDPIRRAIEGETTNVARLTCSLSQMEPGAELTLLLDGEELSGIAWPASGSISVERIDGAWSVASESLDPSRKGPHRAGMFKDAFRHGFVMVYGTQGSDAESAWALEKARYDAEYWAYQGNGATEVIADVDFNPADWPDRSVILYGNADTHEDWDALLGEDCPIRVGHLSLTIGDTTYTPDELNEPVAGVFIYPRVGSDVASVGVVTGNLLGAMKTTTRLRFFVSGAAWPDFFFTDLSMPRTGSDSVMAAGYFTNDWQLPALDDPDWIAHRLP